MEFYHYTAVIYSHEELFPNTSLYILNRNFIIITEPEAQRADHEFGKFLFAHLKNCLVI